jgi:hypothetical protein
MTSAWSNITLQHQNISSAQAGMTVQLRKIISATQKHLEM